jgi:hypothetical protein
MLSLHDQLRAIVTQAFPAGLPLAKKTFESVKGGGEGIEDFAGEIYQVYNRYTDKYFDLTISLNIDDELRVDCAIPAGDDYDKEELLIISHRLQEAKDKPKDPEIWIDFHQFLNGLAQAIGSKKGFGEKAPNDKRPYFTYMAYGSGGRIIVTCDTKDVTYRVNYRSGPAKRDDRINMVDFEHGANYIKTIEKAAGISKVWHTGAMCIVQDYLNLLPIRSFRHPVQERPSYQYDFPFCDIVLQQFPDVCLLRVTHEGYKLWRDGEYVTLTDVADLEITPVLQEIEGFPQAMWRLGGGLLYTTGTFVQTENMKVKFTPSKRG